jgi:hypothetical protein
LALAVILNEASNASAGKDLGQLRVSEAGSGLEIAQRSFGILNGCSNSEPEPAARARHCPRSFLPLALLASSG